MSNQSVILFVDDKPATHADFREDMEKSGDYKDYEILLAFDLTDALDILDDLKQHHRNVAVAIIDLHLPRDIPAKLKQSYEQKFPGKIQLNEGQLLGAYLRQNHPDWPYFYLSAYDQKYVEQWEASPPPPCLEKEADWSAFKDCLDKVMRSTCVIETLELNK